MSDWEEKLDPSERADWDRFVKGVREDAVVKMTDSAFVVSIVPREEPDVKFCVELGLSIMLDKPLLIVLHPETPIPARLLRCADHVVECDIDTEEGREKLEAAITALVEEVER